jgi:ActR/RegA family two-component response regulator
MNRTTPLSNVLVADDDTGYARKLSEELRPFGFATAFADSLKSIELALVGGPSAIVLEPNLPGTSWYAVLDRIKTIGRQGSLVVVTAFHSLALERVSAQAGATAVFSKPVASQLIADALSGSRYARVSDGKALPLARVEWEYLNQTLVECAGNISQTCDALGIARSTLYRKLRKHPPQSPLTCEPETAVDEFSATERSVPSVTMSGGRR